MEEDIKEDLSSIAFSHPFFSDIVVNALNYIEKLEKESDSKEKAYNDCYCEFKHYKQYESIPKSKVKEKIEELNKNELLCKMNFENIKFTIEVLQELLGDEK